MRSKTVDLIKGRLDDSALFRLSQGSSSAKVQSKQQTFFSGVGSHTSVFLIYSLSPSLHHGLLTEHVQVLDLTPSLTTFEQTFNM